MFVAIETNRTRIRSRIRRMIEIHIFFFDLVEFNESLTENNFQTYEFKRGYNFK